MNEETPHEERAFLTRSIRDLDAEHEAGDLSDEDHATLKARYESALARGLPGPPPRNLRRTLVVSVAVVAVAVGAGLVVARSSGDRVAGRPATGTIREGSNDRLGEARRMAATGNAVEAVKLYDQVLRDDPRNVEALAYRGWIVRLAGLADQGLASIDKAIQTDPAYPDAHFFKGVILFRDKGDAAGAVREFETFLAGNPPPELKGAVEGLLAEARQAAASSG